MAHNTQHRSDPPREDPTCRPFKACANGQFLTLGLTDAELLERLERLQDELKWLQEQVEDKLLKTARRRSSGEWPTVVTQAGIGQQESSQNTGQNA
jgi:hypothetical protein